MQGQAHQVSPKTCASCIQIEEPRSIASSRQNIEDLLVLHCKDGSEVDDFTDISYLHMYPYELSINRI